MGDNTNALAALTVQIEAISTIFSNKFTTLEKSNKAFTAEINELKKRRLRLLLPTLSKRRRRDLFYSVEPPDSDKRKEKEIFISIVPTLEKNRFRIKELGYFDGTNNVYVFTDRLKTVNRIKSIKLVKDYLVLYFINPANLNKAYN